MNNDKNTTNIKCKGTNCPEIMNVPIPRDVYYKFSVEKSIGLHDMGLSEQDKFIVAFEACKGCLEQFELADA